MCLWNHTQNISSLYNCCTIVQFVVNFQGQAHGGDHLQVPGGLQNSGQCLLRAPQQGVLVKQVAAGVAGEAQLRQHQHLGAGLFRLAHQGKGLFRVIVAVRQTQLGRATCNGDEAISHMKNLLLGMSLACILHRAVSFYKGAFVHSDLSGREALAARHKKDRQRRSFLLCVF